jgi:predicted metal-dependent hydrolase
MTQNHTVFRRPEGVQVTYRRVHFPFEDKGFDRYWHGGSAFKSLFWSQLSTSFDAGEKFFIDSARALKGHISDPALLAEMNEFCKQEGHHTFQHLKFDRMNAALGVDIATSRKHYGWILDRVRKGLDAMGMLAVTVALEHFTSSLAEQHLSRADLSEGADPNVLALWNWHAVEETEHKATCHDIFRAAGGGYWRRVTTLPVAWGIILGISLWNTLSLLRNDGKLFTRDTLKGLGYLFGRRGVVTGLLPAFFRYFSPKWHPWQEDNSAQIKQWEHDNTRYLETRAQAEQRIRATA